MSGTRYSMVIHPGVKEPVSLSLREVTIPEVLNSRRELYGYDYRVEGTLIYVLPASLQTQLFKVEYLTSLRRATNASSDSMIASNDGNRSRSPNHQSGFTSSSSSQRSRYPSTS